MPYLQVAADEGDAGEPAATTTENDGRHSIPESLQKRDREKTDVLSQALVERWCYAAKEKDSVAAFDKLMKVSWHVRDANETQRSLLRNSSLVDSFKCLMEKDPSWQPLQGVELWA